MSDIKCKCQHGPPGLGVDRTWALFHAANLSWWWLRPLNACQCKMAMSMTLVQGAGICSCVNETTLLQMCQVHQSLSWLLIQLLPQLAVLLYQPGIVCYAQPRCLQHCILLAA